MKTLIKSISKTIVLSMMTFGISTSLMAAQKATNLDELLNEVKLARTAESKVNKDREANFRRDKNRQQSLLNDAKAQLKREEQRSVALKKQFDVNEKQLAELDSELKIKAANLGEMHGVVRQVAADASARFTNSIVSAQFPGRTPFLDDLAQRKELPEIKELQQLWVELQKEMTQSGKVSTFSTKVVNKAGAAEDRSVTRVGSFNLLDKDGFLYYKPDTEEIRELQRQPESKFYNLVTPFLETKSGIAPLAMDPSRGSLLSLLIQKKTLTQYYHQGGVVGYTITVVFVFGVLLVLIRFFGLYSTGKKIKKQMHSSAPGDNPLGRVMKVYLDNRDVDVENLELKMDEAILKETPGLEWGITIVKVLAALSPLMGLLGTVTGMIGTFQSITLFGTGDPRVMAGGISTALVTTVLGLVSAIPLIFLHSIIAGQSKGLIHILEEQSAGLIAEHAEKEG
jgi:biopolymer transport protein ExbB